jgi:hypothetical protein
LYTLDSFNFSVRVIYYISIPEYKKIKGVYDKMDESIVGIISNVRSGLLGQKTYNLIITDKRLIAAIVTSKMLSDAAKQQAADSKERGEGLLKRMASTAFSGYHYHEKYFDMSPDEILSENTDNFYLEPSMIKKISIKHGHYNDHQGRHDPHQLKIKANNGKFAFSFSSVNPKQAKEILSHAFGSYL